MSFSQGVTECLRGEYDMAILSRTDTDRICARSLAGGFGVRLLSPREVKQFRARQLAAGTANDHYIAAAQSFARRGHEQGKL
jgi:hypothetical protein